MHPTSLIAMLVAVQAAPIEKRTADADVLGFRDNLVGITSRLNALSSTLDKVKENDIITLLNVNTQAQALATNISLVDSQLKKLGNFTDAQFLGDLATPLLGLQQPAQDTLQKIVDLESTFAHAILGVISVSGLVKFDVQWIDNSVHSLGTDVLDRTPSDYSTIVTNVLDQIYDSFTTTLNAYQNISPINL